MTRRLVSALVDARLLSSLAVTIGLLAAVPAAAGAVSEPADPIIGAGAQILAGQVRGRIVVKIP